MIPGAKESLVANPRSRAQVYSFAALRGKEVKAPRDSSDKRPLAVEHWQHVAYENNERIPEIAFAHTMLANLFSRGYLRVEELSSNTERGGLNYEKTDNEKALKILSSLCRKTGTMSDLLYSFAQNLLIAGDCYLLGIPRADNKIYDWEVVSVLELKLVPKLGKLILVRSNPHTKDGEEVLPDNTIYYRCFRPDPKLRKCADSAMKHNQELCEEIILLSNIISTSAKSRLNAGVWCVAEELNFDAMDETEEGDASDPSGLDPLSEAYFNLVNSPIEDPKDPNAHVPLLIRGPKEFLPGQDSYIRFDRDIETTIVELRNDALTRVFRGLDIPIENITGKGDVASWSAYAVEQDTITKHVIPLGNIVCGFLTSRFLRPFLIANGMSEAEAEKFVVRYDASEISTKPDMTKTALDLYENYEISGAALRRYAGVDESDAPTEEERKIRVALDKSALSADIAKVLLPLVPGFENVEFADMGSGLGPQGADSKAYPAGGPGVVTTKDGVPQGDNARPRKRAGQPDSPGDSPADSAGAD